MVLFSLLLFFTRFTCFFFFSFIFFSNLFQFSLSLSFSIDLYCLLAICDMLVQIPKIILTFYTLSIISLTRSRPRIRFFFHLPLFSHPEPPTSFVWRLDISLSLVTTYRPYEPQHPPTRISFTTTTLPLIMIMSTSTSTSPRNLMIFFGYAYPNAQCLYYRLFFC